MYTINTLKKGIEYLAITEKETVDYILYAMGQNLHRIEQLKMAKEYKDRFKVPYGLTNKKYKEMLKETQVKIDRIKEDLRVLPNDEYLKLDSEDYKEKKDTIKKRMVVFNNSDEINIAKAKQYPITELLEFNSRGFTHCHWHEEKTPSLHHNKKQNRAHCFAGCGNFDSIDIYMKLKNVDFVSAVKSLC